MYQNWNSFGYFQADPQHINQRIENIECRLHHLMEALARQQQLYQQMQQAYANRSNQQQTDDYGQQNEPSEPEEIQPEQPEPGVPSEKYKLPEKPRRVYIPPGVNGIVRM